MRPEIFSPIAVFDSGIGGLTVLQALKKRYPQGSYVYLGDTARLPYGTKSPEIVQRYSQSLCRILLNYNPSAIVIACNTASTHALEAVRALAAPLPVIGMIEPAAAAAIRATKNQHIGVIATFGTIRSGAYEKELQKINPHIKASSQACQMLVALAEEGWSSGPIATAIVHQYLDPIFDTAEAPDTLILGCTHFPVFEALFRDILGSSVTLINSGEAAATQLSGITGTRGQIKMLATDDPERFAANASKFFDQGLVAADIELIDITAAS
ncbi:glutamate racemase [Nitrosospira multiformis]|uniref:Glutamate racemase n=1 Tax=Nitrosospira multiformis TaxID=1231 RepID=A0A1I7GN03_9PROT|nr:glutamate racemase [Nitrosospira multiformis]SFU49646.1 glutamate racemase [Nitrosospira multiformis]